MQKPLVSVVIPVKNGLPYLPEVLRSVFEQETDFAYEVIVVDSGSRDGSLELVQSYPIKLIQIPPHEFNHGGTRNLAIKMSQGDFVALLTHDATPADKHWLKHLVQPLRIGAADVAGVFGRHIARPGEDPIVEIGLRKHFEQFTRRQPPLWKRDNDYEALRGEYVFFSNNNSCLRRSVWETIPFRETEMAEDQQWAEDALNAGYTKAYAHDSIVIHSHSYPAREWLRRSFDEYRSYYKLGLVKQRGIKETIKNALWLWRNDLRALREVRNGLGYKVLWSLRRFLASWAIAIGQYFGTNFESMPRSLNDLLSMQVRNKRVSS
jgi:rhamnosyltransferase